MIRIIGFDADDTLWHNESIFEHAHVAYRQLLSKYHPAEEVNRVLYATEMRNLALYGYGVKGYMLSCVEAAIELDVGAISAQEIREVLATGRRMLAHPVELLAGVSEVVPGLARDYRLLLITKGDLHHQEKKISESGLAAHFHAIEIVSEKDTARSYDRVRCVVMAWRRPNSPWWATRSNRTSSPCWPSAVPVCTCPITSPGTTNAPKFPRRSGASGASSA